MVAPPKPPPVWRAPRHPVARESSSTSNRVPLCCFSENRGTFALVVTIVLSELGGEKSSSARPFAPARPVWISSDLPRRIHTRARSFRFVILRILSSNVAQRFGSQFLLRIDSPFCPQFIVFSRRPFLVLKPPECRQLTLPHHWCLFHFKRLEIDYSTSTSARLFRSGNRFGRASPIDPPIDFRAPGIFLPKLTNFSSSKLVVVLSRYIARRRLISGPR